MWENADQNNSEYGRFLRSVGTLGNSHPEVLFKKGVLKTSQKKNTSVGFSFKIKLTTSGRNFIKKQTPKTCFSMNFVKFLRTPFFRWLILYNLVVISWDSVVRFPFSSNFLVLVRLVSRVNDTHCTFGGSNFFQTSWTCNIFDVLYNICICLCNLNQVIRRNL